MITNKDEDPSLTDQNDKKDIQDDMENHFQSAEEDGDLDDDIVPKKRTII